MYMYKSWIAGGVEINQGGGLVSEDTVVSSDRYKVFARLHFSNNKDYINYLSPFIGYDNGSINSFKAERVLDDPGNTTDLSDECLEPGRSKGYDFGLEYGLGWRFDKLWTLMFSVAVSARNDQDYHNESTLGFAYDLAQSWDFLQRGSNELFAYGDSIWAFRKNQWEIIWMLGLGIGF